jgi:hypothetical protein
VDIEASAISESNTLFRNDTMVLPSTAPPERRRYHPTLPRWLLDMAAGTEEQQRS